MGADLKLEFESKLDDLVAEYQRRGADLTDIAAVLELKHNTVVEAINEPNDQ